MEKPVEAARVVELEHTTGSVLENNNKVIRYKPMYYLANTTTGNQTQVLQVAKSIYPETML